MIEIVILAVLTMVGGAAAVCAGRVFLERAADRAADAQVEVRHAGRHRVRRLCHRVHHPR